MKPVLEFNVAEPEPRKNSEITPEAIRSALERMLASRAFRAAEGQKSFLKYAVIEVLAGRADQIKEYVIGTEAFSRGASFDPRLDPIVRTQARKLRDRLAKYYQTEGAAETLRIELPKGSYVPSFQMVEVPCLPAISGESEVGAEVAAETPVTEKSPAPATAPDIQFTRPASARRVKTHVRTHVKTMAAAAIVLVAAIAACAVFPALYYGWRKPVFAPGNSSIAVMPFANVSDKKDGDFLSDGLTDELIHSLRQVPGLHVIARTSVFSFKGKTAGLREIGQQLNVASILEGSVRKSGNRLFITVQLNNAADGYHLWSGSYDRDQSDASAVELEISRSVADILSAPSGRRNVAGLRRGFPNLTSPNPGAYQSYLKGLYFWNKMTAAGLRTAIQYFEQAIAEDPSFARAYTALADCYVMGPQVAAMPPGEIIPKITATATKALELDPDLGEAHFDLAICAEYRFDWAGAEREFKRGFELSPENAVGRLWYAKYLGLTGRKSEVIVQRRIAVQLDPVSPYAFQSLAGYASVMGQYDDAIKQFQTAIAMEPNFGLAHQGLGVAYLLKGRTAEGIAELQVACNLMDGPRRLALLGWAYGISGNKGEAHRILSSFLERSRREPFPALAIAEVYIGLGDKDRAFEWLGKAADQKDLNMDLQWDSFFAPLRTDSRYAALLRRLKLA